MCRTKRAELGTCCSGSSERAGSGSNPPPEMQHACRASATKRPVPLPCRYDDGDDEHLTLEELQRVLLDPQGCQRRLEEAAAAEAGAGGENDENDESGQAAAPTKRRRVAGVLGDATERSRNMAAPGEERRSRWVLRAGAGEAQGRRGNATGGCACACGCTHALSWPRRAGRRTLRTCCMQRGMRCKS